MTGEQGKLHSPEFTMLEWYRPELTLNQLMDEVNALLQQVFDIKPITRLSYRAVFEFYFKINIFTCPDDVIGEDCFTISQVNAIQTVYNGVVNDQGEIYSGFPVTNKYI